MKNFILTSFLKISVLDSRGENIFHFMAAKVAKEILFLFILTKYLVNWECTFLSETIVLVSKRKFGSHLSYIENYFGEGASGTFPINSAFSI